MLRAIIYKEWLKVRISVLISTLVGLIFILDFYYEIINEIDSSTAEYFVFDIVYKRTIWFGHMKYIPISIASLIACTQYIPEVVNDRLKLTFHLPLGERKTLLQMLVFGFGVTALVFSLIFSLFCIISNYILPVNLTRIGVLTILPWFLAGLIAYLWIAFTVLEPTWKNRIIYIVLGIFMVSSYLLPAGLLEYNNVICLFVIITIISGCGVFYTAYRFKKGLGK